ncbi:hypothetical protein VTI28DRAFT_10248 [Corynascus sepedonium]
MCNHKGAGGVEQPRQHIMRADWSITRVSFPIQRATARRVLLARYRDGHQCGSLSGTDGLGLSIWEYESVNRIKPDQTRSNGSHVFASPIVTRVSEALTCIRFCLNTPFAFFVRFVSVEDSVTAHNRLNQFTTPCQTPGSPSSFYKRFECIKEVTAKQPSNQNPKIMCCPLCSILKDRKHLKTIYFLSYAWM